MKPVDWFRETELVPRWAIATCVLVVAVFAYIVF